MGSASGGEILVRTLERAGVRNVFGVPGESFLGVLDALYDSPIEFISTRHEGGAAFMACGYAAVTGEIGVCLGTRAVGAANLAIGIHNAYQDSQPMVAIVGDVERAAVGREAFQEIDLVGAMSHFTKWAVQVPHADRMAEFAARAVHVARSGRPGPVVMALPQDVCEEPSELVAADVARPVAPQPAPDAVRAIRDALVAGRRPLLFPGGGADTPEGAAALVRVAEALEIPIVTSWRRHDLVPNDHRLFLGSASLGAVTAVWDRLADADVVLVIGNRMQENATKGYSLPSPGARLLQVDIDPGSFAHHRSVDVAVQADATAFLEALAGLGVDDDAEAGRVQRRSDNDADRDRFVRAIELPEPAGQTGVSYPGVVASLQRRLAGDGILVTDGGNFYAWFSRFYRFNHRGGYLGPASGSMGYGFPAGIGATLAAPDRPIVAVSGDGGFLMTMQELETAVRYRVPVVAVVMDNCRHGTIRMHQERAHPGRVVGTDLTTPDLAVTARSFGANGVSVDGDEAFDHAVAEALAAVSSGIPTIIHARMDPDQLSVEMRVPGGDQT